MFIVRWINGLTRTQFTWLAVVLGAAAAIGGGFATVKLVERFGWRAAPLLLFLAAVAIGAIVVLLRKIRELTGR